MTFGGSSAQNADDTVGAGHVRVSPYSIRETELLQVTLRLLQRDGYEGLTVDAVAAAAHASKATLYRRWPTKAELVLAAFRNGIRPLGDAPKTGALRDDLLHVGRRISEEIRTHSATIRALMFEMSRNPALNDTVQHGFLDPLRALVNRVLTEAIARGELDASVVGRDVPDVVLGYFLCRTTVSNGQLARSRVQALIDDVIIPSLYRPR